MYSGLYVRGLRRGAGRRTSGCRQEQQRQQHGPVFSSGSFHRFFWGGVAVEVFAEPFDFAGEFVDFAEQFLLGDQPVGLFPA